MFNSFRTYKPPRLEAEETLLSPGRDPERKPRIIVSLDRSWHNALGLTRLAFFHMIRRAGGVPRWVDYGSGPEPGDLAPITRDIIATGDALLLSGGSDVDPKLYGSSIQNNKVNPRRDRFEMALIAEARANNLPILGVCRGSQLLNVAHGGTLRTIRFNRDLSAVHNSLRHHHVTLVNGSRIARSTGRGTLSVVSIHGQAAAHLGHGLWMVGKSTDGVIEAIEAHSQDDWVVGVQWHPEYMIYARPEHALIETFVQEATRDKMNS